ncbi:MAG: EamA family transporter RarD [Gammaproteobacteria bacterium]|nr:EamA family transporter RarD [Gammaproteobacteria bacterium]MBL6998531.1 EamA family transporter RarD [Gammaproteobacteria bacterium]
MPRQQLQGLIAGFLAYAMWGLFPLFFNLLRDVPSIEVLLHRVIWSFVFVGLIILGLGQKSRFLQVFNHRALLLGLLMTSLLVSFNWLVYIWTVAQGRVLEASLGYFLTPLVSVFLARVFLREALDPVRWLAILLAAGGILWLVVNLGTFPWVSLSLALSFGLYGLLRKQLEVDPLTGLAVETVLLLPIALAYAFYLGYNEAGHFISAGRSVSLLLMACGVVTAVPLLFFAAAAKKLSLSAIGFMMYINPSLQFVVAIYLLDEAFKRDQLVGFVFIWAALMVFTVGSIRLELKHSP